MIQSELTEKELTTISEESLIHGEFTPDDASEIINHMISKKINFHERRNFSSQIRFGEVDQHSVVRIQELKACKASLNAVIQQAKEQGKKLRVSSSISVELI